MNKMIRSCCGWVAVAFFAITGISVFGQPVVTVTPSVISNTYPGFLTLTITGLTNGENVTVQKWLDQNGNGIVDGSEPLVDQFPLTDNDMSNALIGGATNVNVPFDSNPALGSISATLNVPTALVVENLVGHFVYRVVSPTGRFAPVTTTFTVTNSTLAQAITGTVYAGGAPLPYAVVVAQDLQANDVSGGTVADGSGHYQLNLKPGNYGLLAAIPNYYQDQSIAPMAVLTNGVTATNDIYLTNGTATIFGSIYNTGNSNGIAGLMFMMGSGNYFAIGFTDTNGNFAASVTPSFWTIQPIKQRLARRAFVMPEAKFQVDVTSGVYSNANIGLPRGTAMFYGRVTDNLSNSYPNVEVDGSTGGNVNNSYDAKGYTDANGNYAVAVLGDATNSWYCNVNDTKNTTLANYILNTFSGSTMTNNQKVLQNFVALPATARISGHVQDNSGSNVTGVSLFANATIGNISYQSLDGTTDNSGNYSIAVAPGQWNVEFLNGGYQDNLDAHGYMDPFTPHIVNIPPTNAILNMIVYPIGTPIISSPQRYSATQFGFMVNGASNVNYSVYYSTNLASTNWTMLFSFLLTSNPFPVADQSATNRSRFYRVQKN